MRSDLNDHVELFARVICRIWKEEMLLPNWLVVAANFCRSKIILVYFQLGHAHQSGNSVSHLAHSRTQDPRFLGEG